MNWAVWDKSDERGDHKTFSSMGRLADREKLKLQLVCHTEDECRVIDIEVDDAGTVIVEHSTTASSNELEERGVICPEDIRRVTLFGWEDV